MRSCVLALVALTSLSCGGEPARRAARSAPELRVVASDLPTTGAAAESVSGAEPEPQAEPEPAPAPAQRALGEPLVEPERTRATVLLYHGFDRGTDPLSVSSKNFERHIEWLLASRVEIVHTSELIEFMQGKRRLSERVAVITIDDGLRSVYERAWPILQRHGVRFTIGLPTGVMEEPKNAPVMSWDQVREMVASGLCEVASHGHMHRHLPKLEGRRRFEELELSWQIIERRLGTAPVAYFYPLGAFDVRSAAEVRKVGYAAAFKATGAPIALGSSDHFWLPRASVFYADGAHVGHFFGARFLGQVRARPSPTARASD
ncbi:MAG: polysaccharide deacetylase family protein [Polyangiaceae bacterium]|nr:polysaccharide deacetylase family protein [Polyangiaceae bacterium]